MPPVRTRSGDSGERNPHRSVRRRMGCSGMSLSVVLVVLVHPHEVKYSTVQCSAVPQGTVLALHHNVVRPRAITLLHSALLYCCKVRNVLPVSDGGNERGERQMSVA